MLDAVDCAAKQGCCASGQVAIKKTRREAGFSLQRAGKTSHYIFFRRVRASPMPSKPRPNSASVAGSGTVVAGVNTARMIMSSWLSSGPAPESSQNSQAELPTIDIAIDWNE